MSKIINFWHKSCWGKFILIGSVFFFFLIAVGLLSPKGQENIKKGVEKGKSTESLPEPPLSSEGYILDQRLNVTVHPTKIAKNYTIVYMTTNFDKNNQPYNDIFVVPNNTSQIPEQQLLLLTKEIKRNECRSTCYIFVYSNKRGVELFLEYSKLETESQKGKWMDNYFNDPDFQTLATYDSDSDKFTYEVLPTEEPTEIPTPQKRKLIKASTPRGEEFFDKVNALHNKGVVVGELYTEFESDPVVDINPEAQSVQLSLKYSSITDSVDEGDKKAILRDFRTIKGLAEQDQSLKVPGFGTLRVFVLTFHDVTGVARGELEQLMIEEEPQWFDM